MHNKLLYIANARIPTEKAHGLAIMKMCEAFSNNGMDVELIVPRRKTHINEDPFDYYGVKKNFKISKLWCLDTVKFGRLGFWLETLSFTTSAIGYVIFKDGILYTRDEFAALSLKMFGKRTFWEAHTAKGSFWTSVLKRVDGVITISVGLKDYYVTQGLNPANVMVAHSGVDLSSFEISKNKKELREELSLPIDKKIVAYIGKRHSMGKEKGVEELESVLQSISAVNPTVHPLLVTNASPKSLPSYMKASDILVMNYPSTEHYAKYMSPLKLFEYMASATPIVAPRLPSIMEVLDESTAYLFNSNSREGLVMAIKDALNEGKIAQNKAVKALENIHIYTWDTRAKNILKFIK